jgi:hypothetical protein
VEIEQQRHVNPCVGTSVFEFLVEQVNTLAGHHPFLSIEVAGGNAPWGALARHRYDIA